MPDKALEEKKRYNDAIISLERERLDWDKQQDIFRIELEKAQREQNEARESEIQTRICLNQRPVLKFQPSKTFNDFRTSILLVMGVGLGTAVYKLVA